ncbi:unnamed protein product [Enterobius vermicularis]|uniref:CRAL-TRIO domain-containing protein n=1 Tax=Enterobius vermicularis TaxID=51028 RepID=A0A0N4VG80_ENTVE|nr:unnamed protein product [Enterobius vermicularis]
MTATDYILTNDQRTSIEEVLRIVGPKDAANKYCTPFNVLRWINNFDDIEEAAKRLQYHLNVRQIKRLDTIHENNDELNKTFSKHFPLHVVGRNRFDDNKVVVYEPTGNIDVYNLLEKVQFTPFMKSRFQKLEAVLRTVNKYEEETKQLSSAILIINLEGLVLQSNLVNIVKGPYRIMWGTLFDEYPQLFSRIVVINAPSFMNIIWAAVSQFLDAELTEKITILTEETHSEIFEYIDPSYLPTSCGGELDDESLSEKIPSFETFPPPSGDPNVLLKELIIPAGGSLVQVYHFDENTELEFYLNHQEEFSYIILYSEENIDYNKWGEEELQEVYAGCELPGLATTDYWKWKTPYTGYYYICYGNEKAWFYSVLVNHLINICDAYESTSALPIAEF